MLFKPRPATVNHHLHLRNIYVLPTRAGFLLLATLCLLLVASINFQLNLGYALTFLIAGSAFASIFTAYRTLRGVTLAIRGITPVFMQSALTFTVSADNPENRTRYGIGIAIHDHGFQYEKNEWVWLDIPAKEATSISLSILAQKRGWQPLPTLVIHTRFPMGVFRTWSLWQPAAKALVYPIPEEKAPEIPTHNLHDQAGSHSPSKRQGNEFDGIRPYQPGDPLKRIVWKKILPSGDLISRQTATLESNDLWLTLTSTRLANTEAQLSRLCAWVLQAHSLGIAYGLQLGSAQIHPATGEAHQQRCLKALALYNVASYGESNPSNEDVTRGNAP